MARFDGVTQAGLHTLVSRFYSRVREDDVLGPVFEAAVSDWDEHEAQLGRFWASVVLGARSFKGDPLGVHRRLPIQPEMFPRWLGLWETTIDELFEAEPARTLRTAAQRIGASLDLGLFYRPASQAAE